MNEDKSIMKFESLLPEDFSGVFNFTNWTDEDFIGKWGGKEYRYTANSTSPMLIPDHSPIEIQHIRKKFAKDLAEIQFYKSKKYTDMLKQERNADGSPRNSGIHQAATYTISELTPFIQKCLEDLPISKATITIAPKVNLEDTLTRNEDGQLNSEAIDKRTSLKAKALSV